MNPTEPSGPQAAEALSGQHHAIGALQLRRFVMEGATLVLEQSQHPALQQIHSGVALLQDVAPETLSERLPQKDALLVCLGQDWKPAPVLAERLSALGYQHVYTAETHWAGQVATAGVGGQA